MRFALASLVFFVAASASASVMQALPLERLTERADRIVLGKVESQTAHWTDDHARIYTDVTLRVEASYKGRVAPGGTVTFRREGGSVAGIGMKVFGAAELTVGEDALVFIEERQGASYVVGMAQGKLHVERTPEASGGRAVQNLSSVSLLGPPDPRLQGDIALEELEQQIRDLVKTQKPVQK